MAKNHSSKLKYKNNKIERAILVFIILLLAALYFKANISGLTTFEFGEEGPATLTWAPEPAPEIPAEEQPAGQMPESSEVPIIVSEEVSFSTDIRNANNSIISAAIILENTETQETKVGYSDPDFSALASLSIPAGTYKITVTPASGPIKEIEFQPIAISSDVLQFIRIDDTPEFNNFTEVYAIDPTSFAFSSATVTAVAKGDILMKCKDWDFENQTCADDNWVFVQAITPGQPYTITLTSDDPAYSETLQPSDIDASARSGYPSTNFGTDTYVRVQSYYDGSTYWNDRTFIRFNLSSIPSNATILSANLSLYRYGIGTFAARTYNIHRVNASWTEAGITSNNQPAVAGSATSSTGVGATINAWYAWNVTSDVKGFVNGSYANYGWRISDSVESSGSPYTSDFYSTNYATNTSRRPKLNVYYLVDTPPNSTLVSPANGNVTANNNVSFACNATDDFNLANMTFYWNYTGSWLANGTNTVTGTSNQTSFNRTNLTNGAITWNCQSCDNASQCAFAPANRTVIVNYTVSDTTPPIITVLSPLNQTYNYTNMWFNATANEAISIWIVNYNGTNVTLPNINTTLAVEEGSHHLLLYANDTVGNWGLNNSIFFTIDLCPLNLVNTSWSAWQNISCIGNQMNQSRNLTQYDANNCNEVANQTFYEYRLIGPTYANTTWSNWYNMTACRTNDTVLQERNATQYDTYACAANTTIYGYQATSCNYCSYNVTNITSVWQNQTACQTNNTLLQNRSITEYDSNYSTCYAVTVLPSDLWNSGNNNTYWKYQTINCNYDGLPNITIVSPINTTYGNLTQLVNITVQDSNISQIWYSWNETNYTYTIPINITFNEGSNTLHAYSNDSAGNFNSTNVTFTTDTIMPQITIHSPQNTIYNNATILVNFTADSYQALWFNNGTTNISYTTQTYITAQEGATTFTFYANDSARNLNSTTITFTIDTLASVVAYVSPTPGNNTNITVDHTTINITAVDATTAINTCILDWNGTNYTMTKVGSGLSVSCIYNIAGLIGGNYTYQAYANDSAGNTKASGTRVLQVIAPPDTTPPTINLISPANGTTDTDGNLLFEYNVADTASSIANCSLIINSTLNETDTTIIESITQSFAKTLADGYYNWSVNCTDNSTNYNEGSAVTWDFTVNTTIPVPPTPPTPPSSGPTSGGVTPEPAAGPGFVFSLPLEAGETAELDIENHIDIISIALTSAESFLPDAKARIYELSTGPASVPPLTNIIYKYWQIISEHSRENEPFSKVEVEFRVNKQWSDRYSVDMNTLRLNRYDNGWTALPTKFTGEDSNYYYFVGESPGLSLFGVNATAKKLIVTPVTPPVVKVTYAPTNILFLLLFALMSLYLLHKRYHGKFGWWRRKHHAKLSIKNQFSWWPQE